VSEDRYFEADDDGELRRGMCDWFLMCTVSCLMQLSLWGQRTPPKPASEDDLKDEFAFFDDLSPLPQLTRQDDDVFWKGAPFQTSSTMTMTVWVIPLQAGVEAPLRPQHSALHLRSVAR
jgi:hypothetical protein